MAEPSSTSNTIPAASSVSKEEAASFELDPHLLNLMWDEPFFSVSGGAGSASDLDFYISKSLSGNDFT